MQNKVIISRSIKGSTYNKNKMVNTFKDGKGGVNTLIGKVVVNYSAVKTEDMREVPGEIDANDDSSANASEDENYSEGEVLIESDDATGKAPDGGWGWMVVFGCLMINTIIGGFVRSSGIFYVKFSEIFGESASRTAWVMSLSATVRLLTGPFVSVLCKTFSCRKLVFFGSGLFAIAVHISAYASSLDYLYLSYSVLGGLGRSFILNPLPILLCEYFDKRRSLAFGLSSAGFGIGGVTITPVVEFIFQQYGFKRTFFLLSIIAWHLFVFVWLLRPIPKMDSRPEKTKKAVNVERNDGSFNNEVSGVSSTKHVRLYKMDGIANTVGNPQESQYDLSDVKVDKENDSRQGTVNKLLSFSALKNIRFFTLCIATVLFAVGAVRVFLPALAKSRGISDIQATYLVSIFAGSDTVSKIIAGFVLDLKGVQDFRPFVYNAMSFIQSFALFLYPYLQTFEQFVAVCILHGVCMGTKVAQRSVIVVDILGVERLANSFAILLACQGLGTLFSPPLCGFLKDAYGNYDCAFYFGGTCTLLSSIILAGGNIRNFIDK